MSSREPTPTPFVDSVLHTTDFSPASPQELYAAALEMAAYVVVVDGPWFTAVELDADSARADFAIRDVPAGEYRATAWHKKLKQKGGPATVTVAPGGTAEVEFVITKAKYARTSD